MRAARQLATLVARRPAALVARQPMATPRHAWVLGATALSRRIWTEASPTAVPKPVSVAEPAAGVNVVGYITDVEGNLDYFKRSVEASDAVQFDAAFTRLELAPNAMFVFGGDAFDKGVGDTIIARMLVDLKRRHPDRVFLLLGNRDLNKMKLTSELHPSDIERDVSDIPGPYWVDAKSPGYVTLEQYLSSLVGGEAGTSDKRLLNSAHTAVTRLQYMYRHQMGCAHTFEFRRSALAAARGVAPFQIRDTDVVQDVLASVSVGGAVFDYLRVAQLAVLIGDTVFVHGAVTSDNIGFVPADVNHDLLRAGPPPGYDLSRKAPVGQWIEQLNAYAAEGVRQWIEKPTFTSSRGRRGGDALFGYGYMRAMKGRTVLPASYMDANHHPQPPNEDVVQYLNSSGVRRAVSGHQPFGDSPQIMRMPGHFEVVIGDTSFSDVNTGDPLDTRGKACSAVHIEEPFSVASRVRVDGVLADGTALSFALPPVSTDTEVPCDAGVDLIGTQTPDGWWIKAKIDSGDVDNPTMLLSRGQGYDVQFQSRPLQEL